MLYRQQNVFCHRYFVIFPRGLNSSQPLRFLPKNQSVRRDFAAQAGIGEPTAQRIVRDGERARIVTIGKIAKFFNVDAERLIITEAEQ